MFQVEPRMDLGNISVGTIILQKQHQPKGQLHSQQTHLGTDAEDAYTRSTVGTSCTFTA